MKRKVWTLFQLPFFLAAFFRCAWISSRDADLIHAYWSASACVALGIKFLRKTPVVLHLWGSDAVFTRTPGIAGLFKKLILRADAVICENQEFRARLQALGVAETLIELIPNGIDLERFKPGNKSAARQELGLAPDSSIVLSVGSFAPHKGHRFLIEALPIVLATVKNVQFVLVGDGKMKDPLVSQVQSTGLASHVQFTGVQPASALPKWYQAADLFVIPSLSEGTPNVLIEAMACGLPIVATNVGGVGEIIKHGVNGLLVAPQSADDLSDSLLSLIKNPELRTRLAQSGADWIQSHGDTWKNQAQALLALYERVLYGSSV